MNRINYSSNGLPLQRKPLQSQQYPVVPVLIFTTATLLLAVAGCKRESVVQLDDGVLALGAFEETAVFQRGVSVGTRTLEIESETGAVHLEGTNGTEATFRFTVRARGDSRSTAKAQIDKLVIEESGGESTFRYNVIPDRPELTTIDIDGEIPYDTSLRLVLRNGDVILTNLEGAVDVRHENGSIVYLGGSETVGITTQNGDVFADFYDVSVGAGITLNASNGDISIGFPAEANVTVDARTRAGTVSIHDLSIRNQRLSRKGAGAVFTGRLGDGAASVYLNTSNGSLSLERIEAVPPSHGTPEELIPMPEDSTNVLDDSSPADSLQDDSTPSSAEPTEREVEPVKESAEPEKQVPADTVRRDTVSTVSR